MLAHPNPWGIENYGADAFGLTMTKNAKSSLAKSIKLKLDAGLKMCHKAKYGYAF